MRKILVAGMTMFTLCVVPAFAVRADDPVPVKIFPGECTGAGSCTAASACVSTDRASLAFWRTRCDDLAETLGWSHGVFRPEPSAPVTCPADTRLYVCEGVGLVPHGPFCGGIAAFPCPEGYTCIDDPRDACDPAAGGADCSGICIK